MSPSVWYLTGHTPEECLGLPVTHGITDDTFQRLCSILSEEQTHEESGLPCDPRRSKIIEVEQFRKDGSKLWTELSVTFLRDKSGRPAHILGVTRDISARKCAELALRESEARFRKIAEVSPAVFWVTAPDGSRVFYVSPAFEKICACPCQSLYNNPWLWMEMLHPEDQEPVLFKLRKSRGREIRLEYRIIRADGSIRWIRNRTSPVFNDEGELILLSGMAEDVTDLKKAEEERRLYESRLNRAQKMEAIGTLAGGIAHDFNNILSAIIGYTELTLDDIPGRSPVCDHLEEVLKASERAKDLVKQILAFSRQVETERSPVKVYLIVKEALKLLRSSLPSTIRIMQDIDSASGAVLADPTHIHQVVMNLCTNAYQAMADRGGELTVSLTLEHVDAAHAAAHPRISEGDYLTLSVSDTGCGMDHRTMEQIFDPFFTTRDKGTGTGLGLATVHGIVTKLGGDVVVSSVLGQGSTFDVYLPRFREEKGITPQSLTTIPQGCGEHILLVDDEETILQFTTTMLKQLGYEVATTSSGISALEVLAFEPGRFKLVITDQIMPQMTGAQLAAALQKQHPALPVILMTGYSEFISGDKVVVPGVSRVIEKPFSRSSLATTIFEVLHPEPRPF